MDYRGKHGNEARRLGTLGCAAVLALTLCCPPLGLSSAHADDASDVSQAEEVSTPSATSSTADSSGAVASNPTPQETSDASPTETNASNNQSYAPAQTDIDNDEVAGETQDNASKAQEKLEQAEAIYKLIESTQSDFDRLSAEYEEAERIHNETIALGQEKQALFKQANETLDAQKEELSGFVVEMYKQGGMTPYYDVLLGATSYREFLTSWYMMNEVSVYGRDAIRKQNYAIWALKAEVKALENRAQETEKAMKQARAKMARVELTRLASAPQAAALKMEAAELLGDETMLADAKSEFEQASTAFDEAMAQGLASEMLSDDGGVFTHPCPDAVYSSGFGYRSFDNAFHKGVDLAISEGTPYYAAESGTVTAATNDGGYNGGAGNWVVIDHGNGLVTKYMHSLATMVKAGDHVERGQIIGLVGNTGNSFGAHLHFQVEINNVAVDPVVYLAGQSE